VLIKKYKGLNMSPKQVMVNPKNGRVVKKAEDLITASYELSELSIKLMSVVIAMIRKDDQEFAHRYIVRIQDWKELSGLSGRSVYDNLLKSAKELQENPIHIQREKSWLVLNWLASAEYVEQSGEIELEISSKLRPYLLELQGRFLEYGIENILKLRGSYVMRLYEILKHEYNKIANYNNQKSVIYEIEVDEIRKRLALPDSYQYGHIKTRIFEQSVKQFQDKTDIKIEYKESEKRGKEIKKIEFTIRENTKGSNDFLKTEQNFIEYMRKNFVNKTIFKALDKHTDEKYDLSIDPKGRLYGTGGQVFNAQRSKEMWTTLYELAKTDKLMCLKIPDLF